MTKKLDRYIAKKKGDPLSEDSPFDAISNGEWTDGIIPYEFESGFGEFLFSFISTMECWHSFV